MSDEKKDSKSFEELRELAVRKVSPLEAIVFSLTFVTLVVGSTIFLRSHFELRARDISTAGLLAMKDFIFVSTIVSLFELTIKQKRHPIRYGVTGGAVVFVVTFVYWAFFS